MTIRVVIAAALLWTGIAALLLAQGLSVPPAPTTSERHRS